MPKVDRDPQAKFLYRAEFNSVGFGGFFTDVEDAQLYVNHIVKSRWWKNRSEVYNVRVEYLQRPGAWCVGDREGQFQGVIQLVHPRLCETYILHELTHVVTRGVKQDHGPRFCANYLEMIERWMGRQWRNELELAMGNYHVNFSPREDE